MQQQQQQQQQQSSMASSPRHRMNSACRMLHVACCRSHVGRSREAQSLASLDDGRPRANSVLQQVEAKVRLSPPAFPHRQRFSCCWRAPQTPVELQPLVLLAANFCRDPWPRPTAAAALTSSSCLCLLFHSTTITTHARDVALTIALSRPSRQPLTDRFFRTTPILTSRVSLRPNSNIPARLV